MQEKEAKARIRETEVNLSSVRMCLFVSMVYNFNVCSATIELFLESLFYFFF